ncbi:MAG: hypothetical protein WD022_11900 [Balneolaceae bacterium]
MPIFDVTILTDSRFVNPPSPGEYVRNVLSEDKFVKTALENKGLSVTRKDWADPDFDWTDTGVVLFRTTWDYFYRLKEFKNWLINTYPKTTFINSSKLIDWNIDKHYLVSLSQKNIRIVPTRFVPRGTAISLEDLHALTGWNYTVIKPTIGGGGRHTYSIGVENIPVISRKLKNVMKEEDFMLQPFQHSITEHGEWSYVFFGNQFSHSVLKKAREGDFRVQDDFGGTVHSYQPTQKEIDFALSVVHACPELPVYSRVDILIDNDGELAVSELELIEPELWFRLKPEAANLLADEVIKKVE